MGVWYYASGSDWATEWWGNAGNTDTTILGSSVGSRMLPSAGRNRWMDSRKRTSTTLEIGSRPVVDISKQLCDLRIPFQDYAKRELLTLFAGLLTMMTRGNVLISCACAHIDYPQSQPT